MRADYETSWASRAAMAIAVLFLAAASLFALVSQADADETPSQSGQQAPAPPTADSPPAPEPPTASSTATDSPNTGSGSGQQGNIAEPPTAGSDASSVIDDGSGSGQQAAATPPVLHAYQNPVNNSIPVSTAITSFKAYFELELNGSDMSGGDQIAMISNPDIGFELTLTLNDFTDDGSGVFRSPTVVLSSPGTYSLSDLCGYGNPSDSGWQPFMLNAWQTEGYNQLSMSYSQTLQLPSLYQGAKIIGIRHAGSANSPGTFYPADASGTVVLPGLSPSSINPSQYLDLDATTGAANGLHSTVGLFDDGKDAEIVLRAYTESPGRMGEFKDFSITVNKILVTFKDGEQRQIEYGSNADGISVKQQVLAPDFLNRLFNVSFGTTDAEQLFTTPLQDLVSIDVGTQGQPLLPSDSVTIRPGGSVALADPVNYALDLSGSVIATFVAPSSALDAESLAQLIKNADGSPARAASDGTIWVRSEQVSLDGIGTAYRFGKLLNGIDGTESLLERVDGINYNQLQDYYLKDVDAAFPRPVCGMPSVRLDTSVPAGLSASFPEPAATYSATSELTGAWAYNTDAVVSLTLQDLQPAPPAASPLSSLLPQPGSASSAQGEDSGVDPASVHVAYGEAAPPHYEYDTATSTLYITLFDSGHAWELSAVEVSFADNAGNAASLTGMELIALTQDPQAMRSVGRIIACTAQPQLSMSFDLPGGSAYYAAARTVTFTLQDPYLAEILAYDALRPVAQLSSNGSDIRVSVRELKDSASGATAPEALAASTQDTVWSYSHSFDTDGDYGASASYTNMSGLVSAVPQERFTIDTMEPMVIIEFDNNDARSGGFYNSPRTATVRVMEKNFSPAAVSVAMTAKGFDGEGMAAPALSGWSSNGDEHTATAYFGAEGTFSMTVSASDAAGNASEAFSEPEFSIDMTAPVITVRGVADRTAYTGIIAPAATMQDTNIESYATNVIITRATGGRVSWESSRATPDAATIKVAFADISYVTQNDDVYTMTTTAADKAGNIVTDVRTFSVNRFGSTYLVSASTTRMIGTHMPHAQDVVITEINPSGLQEAEIQVRLGHDGSSKVLVRGQDFDIARANVLTPWQDYSYTIYASCFADDGYYELALRSIDNAGLISESTMDSKRISPKASDQRSSVGSVYDTHERTGTAIVSFVVDTTAPIASLGSLHDNEYFIGSDAIIDLTFEDNVAIDRAVLVVDDVMVAKYTSADAQAASFGTATYTLQPSDKPQTVALTVWDKAGNHSTMTRNSIVVTSDPMAAWVASPWMPNATMIAIITAVALSVLLAWLLIMRRRRCEQLKDSLVFANTARPRLRS